ncbi:hypothetical protein F4809DRAFT_609049 [Biscogniauxia mediterranea]|nr:hypothetical protein F4809DRAFT_609049 [Biscogniauxia mediterranea]
MMSGDVIALHNSTGCMYSVLYFYIPLIPNLWSLSTLQDAIWIIPASVSTCTCTMYTSGR